ncbi:Lhr family helicase [Legionella nagasakiensis]|uniref:Lhr family helicase n=1 Tax=Legionella nagasakiensis TaxID=535290 RepID=UPI001054FEE1|nr:hypothetical protein [Legionella nagasakiensis]
MLDTFRLLEERGEIRGGRFIQGFTGEQFALPYAVDSLRAMNKSKPETPTITLSAADPLNLAGIILAGERIPALSGKKCYSSTVLYKPCLHKQPHFTE